jgi:hypothetical protein
MDGGLESRSFRLESVLGEFGATKTDLHGEGLEGDLSGVTSRLPLSLEILANTIKAVVSKSSSKMNENRLTLRHCRDWKPEQPDECLRRAKLGPTKNL